MPVITLYPTAVKAGSGSPLFTDAQLTNILGNNDNAVGYTEPQSNYPTVYGGFYFDTSQIPSGAVIDSIAGGVRANCTYWAEKSYYGVSLYHPVHGTIVTHLKKDLTYMWADIVTTITPYTWPVDAIRDPGVVVYYWFLSNTDQPDSFAWRKAWITVDYTPGVPPTGGKNVLYLGENF